MNYHSDHFKDLLLLLIRIKPEININILLFIVKKKRLSSQQIKQQNKTALNNNDKTEMGF